MGKSKSKNKKKVAKLNGREINEIWFDENIEVPEKRKTEIRPGNNNLIAFKPVNKDGSEKKNSKWYLTTKRKLRNAILRGDAFIFNPVKSQVEYKKFRLPKNKKSLSKKDNLNFIVNSAEAGTHSGSLKKRS